MSEQISEATLEFDGELLVPKINLTVYKQIYSLEGWVRRICLTVWMGCYGESWRENLDPRLRKALESRLRRNNQRVYLGAETASDLMWQATQAELAQMLAAESVAPIVRELTGADPEFLTGKLEEIREIRNLLAHNRALSDRTHRILAGLLASLEEAVDTFKLKLLYEVTKDYRNYTDIEVKDDRPFQGFTAQSEDFVEFVCLPVERSSRWPDARLLLKTYHENLDEIVAFCLNKDGDEFSILMPLKIAREARDNIYKKFLENGAVWTNVSFERQSPRFVCNPKIWFYENRSSLQVDVF
jgi:hypothetical protein